ncbi:RAB6A-GEF complex partner protein 1-like [Dendronephthya gigantea]|uniref:RAB6A-GEF complex partner protein 1-like n=1 Tax=Dendronephthya gigantea TaxID=151771 RepID=UPI0010693AC6|nr:RAB6A-GEF complex partner protein 1-like [Dendronephthya gigantea]
MYFAVGWPKYYGANNIKNNQPCGFKFNRDRSILAVLTEDTLTLWYCRPFVVIVSYRRSRTSVDEFGGNEDFAWKFDSSAIVIKTSNGGLIFYELKLSKGDSGQLYVLKNQRNIGNPNYKISYDVPAILLSETTPISIVGGVSSLSIKRNEIFVASRLGILHRVYWNGTVDKELSLPVSSIPFSLDLETPIESAQYLKSSESDIRDMQYSALLGGFAIVLRNGRGGFLSASTSKFEPQDVLAIWARDLTQATCVKLNHKFRIIAYGCTHGGCMLYSFDEVTGALQFSHKIELQTKHFLTSINQVDAVENLCFSPDGHVLAVSWVGGGFAVWSVFGSFLFCSLDSSSHGLQGDVFCGKPWHVSAMEWSVEGYNLLLAIEKPLEDKWSGTGEIVHIPFVKSVLTANPCVANHHHLVLQGETCLYLSTADVISDTRTHLHDAFGIEGSGFDCHDGSNSPSSTKHWQIVQYPQIYIEKNWPIRSVAVDESGMYFAIAGRMGVAHYSLLSRRWKLFGNESQEQSIYCRGGLLWWNEFLVIACYNMHSGSDQIRFYPRLSNLDNAFASEINLTCSPFLINILDNILLVYCSDCKLTFYCLDKLAEGESDHIQISRMQDVSLVPHVPHPLSVIEITLSMACFEQGCVSSSISRVESLLVNIGGKLMMLQRLHEKEKRKKMQFSAPVVLASCVEGIWSSLKTSSTDKQHLVEALWLNCGVSGMKVWLPLFPGDDEKPPNFLSKRIMLPIQMSLCPLVVLSKEALVVGAASEPVHLNLSSNLPISPEEPFPLYALERPAQVYLHHLLRQLLRRNLGIHALRIARSCSELLYFPHVLELMLHEILEEEATASEPLPDAMLPRIVAFIQEFPEYLQTVVHCARKTEVALWSYLFAAVGNPRNLFEKCLEDGYLETAASYLIILQNLETPEVSKQLATILLEATLSSDKYEIARDLVRFLGSIKVSDFDSPPQSPCIKTLVMSSALPSLVDDEEDDLTPLPQGIQSHSQSGSSRMSPRPPLTRISSSDKLQNIRPYEKSASRGRHTSEDRSLTGKGSVSGRKWDSQEHIEGPGGSQHIVFRYAREDAPEGFFLDTILNRHSRKLLSSNRLKDLGRFSAYLDFNLREWLRKERDRAAIVNDFIEAFLSIHRQFDWPFPSRTTVNAITTESLSLRTSFLSSSGNRLIWENHDNTVPNNSPNIEDIQTALSEVELKGVQVEQSEASSVSFSLDDDPEGLEDSTWSYDTNIKDLDDFAGQVPGPRQADREIRFLLQAMSDSYCFDWSLLLSLALRDAPLVNQVIEDILLLGMDELALENFIRLRDGIKTLENWANHECLGYSAFFGQFKTQWQALSEAISTVATRLAENQMTSRNVEQQENIDEGTIFNEMNEVTDEDKVESSDPYDCVVS